MPLIDDKTNQHQQQPMTSSPIKRNADQTSQSSTHITGPSNRKSSNNNRTSKKHHNSFSDNNNWPLNYRHPSDSNNWTARSISVTSSRTSGLAFYSDDQNSDSDSAANAEHAPVFTDSSIVDQCSTPRNVQIKESLLIPMLRKENSFKRADQY